LLSNSDLILSFRLLGSSTEWIGSKALNAHLHVLAFRRIFNSQLEILIFPTSVMVLPIVAAGGVAVDTAPIWIPIVVSFIAVIGAAGMQLVSGRKDVNWDEAWEVGTIVAMASPIGEVEAGAVRGAEGLAAKASARALAAGEKELPKAAGKLGPELVAAAKKELANFPDIAKGLDVKWYKVDPANSRVLGKTFFSRAEKEPLLFGDKAIGITFFTDAVNMASKELGKIIEKITPIHEVEHVASTSSEVFWKGTFELPVQARNVVLNIPVKIGKDIQTLDEHMIDMRIGAKVPEAWKAIQQTRGLPGTEPYVISKGVAKAFENLAKTTGDPAYSKVSNNVNVWIDTLAKKGVPAPAIAIGASIKATPTNSTSCVCTAVKAPAKPAPSSAKSSGKK
jgi:hypothetical protein